VADGELPLVRRTGKSETAFRTISEVAEVLDVPQHVLRFWESKFPQVRPLKRGGGRRYYRPEDVALLRKIRNWLYGQGYTIKGVQKLLREGGEQDAPSPPAPPEEEAPMTSDIEPLVPDPDIGRDDLVVGNGEDGEGGDFVIAEPREIAMLADDTRSQLSDILRELEQIRAILVSR
jgi:DNA-binding transcriptional MerR regulator